MFNQKSTAYYTYSNSNMHPHTLKKSIVVNRRDIFSDLIVYMEACLRELPSAIALPKLSLITIITGKLVEMYYKFQPSIPMAIASLQ